MTTPEKATTLEGPIAALREKMLVLLGDITNRLTQSGLDAESDVQRLRDITHDLQNMFFIVAVIGEFNAGKSSFVNALIGESLLPTGITPTTEYIELIRYSETPERKATMVGDSLREWAHPNIGSPGVAIVDTPGTGSVFQKHEKTAKDFLHRSDLVLFVISAKHAFAETERMYLELAKQYGKKIILILNQRDLLDAGELSEVRRFIEVQAKETLGFDPLIFMVSAKEALESVGNDAVSTDVGGFDAVKAHLRGVYSEAPPAKQKLLAQLDTVQRIIELYRDKAKERADLVSVDIIKVQDVKQELQQQSIGLETRMKESGAEITKLLEGVRRRGLAFIDANLTIRKIGRGVDRQKLQDEFDDVVIGRSLRDINEAAGDYINAVVDQSRLYWRGVVDRLNRLQDLMEQEATGLDKNIYAEQRASLEDAIRKAEAELKVYSTGQVVTEMKATFDTNMGGFQRMAAVSLGGAAVAVIGFVTPGVAGTLLSGAVTGVLAPLAFAAGSALAVVAGVPMVQYMRRLARETKKDFNERIDMLIKNYDTALNDLTSKERNRLTQYGNQVLTPVFSRLEVLSKRYADERDILERFRKDSDDLRGRINDLS